ncbi:hypothetical protein KC354_g7367 [Hortaea werneckii]|nr:hypothetical protein KC354_g7367 [Hortaea werneckii]
MLAFIIAFLLHQVTSSDFQCPASNNLIVQDDYGVQYVVSCGTDADPGAYASNGAYNSWNDCFEACSTHSIDANGAGGPCNGFTYAGALNGRGGGTCYFKSGNMRFVGSGSGLVSVATPERCPGCNIAGYANGTSPRSSSAPGVLHQHNYDYGDRHYDSSIQLLHNGYHHGYQYIQRDFDDNHGTNHYPTSVDGHLCLNIQHHNCCHIYQRCPGFNTTQLTTVTYVSTQPTTVVSTYISTQPASTNTATITQRTTVVSTYSTTSVVTQKQTSTAAGTTFTTTSVFTSTYPVTATETTSFYTTSTAVSTYRTTATVTSVQPASTIERTQTQQTTVRETSVAPGPTQTVTSTQLTTYVSTFTTSYPYTTTLPGRFFQITKVDASNFTRPCLNLRSSNLHEARQCNHHYCFLGDIDHEDHNCFHLYNYNPGDSDSAWRDHSGDNNAAWHNSHFNLGPNRFRTYGHLHYRQHQLRRGVCDLCDPNSCVCPNVEQLRISAIVFGIDSIGFFFGFSHTIRWLLRAVANIFLGCPEFFH